jgi:hypothetical protein
MLHGKCTICGSKGTNKLTCPYNPMAINPKIRKHNKLQLIKKVNNKNQYNWNRIQKGGSSDIVVKTYTCNTEHKTIPIKVINAFYFEDCFDQNPFIKFGKDVYGINIFTDKTIPDFGRKCTYREPSVSIKNLLKEQLI